MATTLQSQANRSVISKGNSNSRDVLAGLIEKNRIIGELIEGRVSLNDAASRFRQAHVAAEHCLERTTGVTSRSFETENTCRTLIGWVRLTLRDRPEHADRVTARLEEELSNMPGGKKQTTLS